MSGKPECLGICMDDNIKAQLNRIEFSTNRIERAVFGEEASGLPGLVSDVRGLKHWRDSLNLKTATIAGGVAAAMLGVKAVWVKLFG